MIRAGADVVVIHLGLTLGSLQGAQTCQTSLIEAPKMIQEIIDSAKQENPDVILLAHGGPLNSPETFHYVLQHTIGLHGFYGASAIERDPVHRAIKKEVELYLGQPNSKLLVAD